MGQEDSFCEVTVYGGCRCCCGSSVFSLSQNRSKAGMRVGLQHEPRFPRQPYAGPSDAAGLAQTPITGLMTWRHSARGLCTRLQPLV